MVHLLKASIASAIEVVFFTSGHGISGQVSWNDEHAPGITALDDVVVARAAVDWHRRNGFGSAAG